MASPRRPTVLITGASQGGAGHALALEFASKGMQVFATARSIESLAGLEEKGIEVLTLDVTSSASIASLKDEITRRTSGILDFLFNNAGSLYEAPAIEADPVRVRAMFDANVFGLFDMVSEFTPLLLAAVSDSNHPPTIINTASVLARVPYPFSSAYNASKAAVAMYSDTLRLELAPLGIKVVTLYMGVVSTRLSSAENVQFGPNSIYIDAEPGVKHRSKQYQAQGMKPADFARQVVDELVVKKRGPSKGEYLWKGANAGLVWFLNAVGWHKIFDSISESGVNLESDVKKSIAEKGRAIAKKKV
ncbi:NADPH-dependent 1-acyldihydroxyacetone phosphate reductase 4 [Colletotrichum chlorophyti]|uniref:NADPH-dependent 1-acyldihydroxyacetone phosphate reductase 4 n=1 Tax=Colletotrichum chlorophyti TaxID=708187 RepID=A0A1Q8RQL2_9PEZI|nr:NADPH-dependent 1-acyldihydroxyacetone phosphate reductase 4 [Colletotrichum chlorophyti]